MKFIIHICCILLKLIFFSIYFFIFSCESLLQHVALRCGVGLLSSCGSWVPELMGSVVATRRLSSYGTCA